MRFQPNGIPFVTWMIFGFWETLRSLIIALLASPSVNEAKLSADVHADLVL